jgi:hypothetical protein
MNKFKLLLILVEYISVKEYLMGENDTGSKVDIFLRFGVEC